MKRFKTEACVETIAQGVLAEKRGADRIELCRDLSREGLTPSDEAISEAAARISIPIRVMIRPHDEGFYYSAEDVALMKASIAHCKRAKLEGVVFGAMQKEKQCLDMTLIEELTRYASPLKVTIHKVVDSCEDPLQELIRLQEIPGIDAVLTSGKSATAMEGISLLKEMLSLSTDQLDVIVCGRVTNDNVSELDQILEANFYHGKKIVGSLAS